MEDYTATLKYKALCHKISVHHANGFSQQPCCCAAQVNSALYVKVTKHVRDVFWQRRLENEKLLDPSHNNALCHTTITECVCVCLCVCVFVCVKNQIPTATNYNPVHISLCACNILQFLTLKFRPRGHCFVSTEEFQETITTSHTAIQKEGFQQ